MGSAAFYKRVLRARPLLPPRPAVATPPSVTISVINKETLYSWLAIRDCRVRVLRVYHSSYLHCWNSNVYYAISGKFRGREFIKLLRTRKRYTNIYYKSFFIVVVLSLRTVIQQYICVCVCVLCFLLLYTVRFWRKTSRIIITSPIITLLHKQFVQTI